MAHAFNPSTWEVEAGGFWVQGQPGLYRETLSQNKQTNKQNKAKQQQQKQKTTNKQTKTSTKQNKKNHQSKTKTKIKTLHKRTEGITKIPDLTWSYTVKLTKSTQYELKFVTLINWKEMMTHIIQYWYSHMFVGQNLNVFL